MQATLVERFQVNVLEEGSWCAKCVCFSERACSRYPRAL